MKRNKSMYIGIFFLLFGLSIILKAVFHIDLPIFRVLIGIFLIAMGIKMVFGCSVGGKLCHLSSANGAIFTRQNFVVSESSNGKHEYNVVFGSGTVDLTKMEAGKVDRVTINVVFGEGVVLYDPKQALQIRSSAVFGSVSTPEGPNEAFGDATVNTGSGTPVEVRVNSVFGAVRFKKQTAAE